MGTYGGYSGPEIICADRIEEFASAVSKILNYGGMMHLRNVEMYSKQLNLLDPVTIEKGKDVDFCYNYFEETCWENAGYVYGNQHFYSNKIGSREFNHVVTAVYCLYELYDEGAGLAYVDGEIVDSKCFVGWFNHLFGQKFSMANRFSLWDKIESFALKCVKYGYDDPVVDTGYLRDIIPEELMVYVGGVELSDLLYIMSGTETLTNYSVAAETYPEDVLNCKKAILEIIEKYGSEDTYSKIKDLLHKSYDDRSNESDPVMKKLSGYSLFLHARTILYLICEQTEKNFWVEWHQEKDNVYKDEKLKKYAPDPLEDFRKKGREKPVEEVTTSEFLKNDGPFAFFGTPEELEDRPSYYLSDADRLYWWDGSDEVFIDVKTDRWLKERAEEYQKALADLPDKFDAQAFIKEIIELLYDVEDRYKRVFAFQNMFYEFIANGTRKEYHAAIEVLRKLYEDNKDDARYLENIRNWNLTSKNVICVYGRMNMKRYLALLANVELRKKYLGF